MSGTLFAYDYSGSPDGKVNYHKTSMEIYKAETITGQPTILLWDSVAQVASFERFSEINVQLEGNGGTSPGVVATYVVGNNFHGRLVLITDGQATDADINKADSEFSRSTPTKGNTWQFSFVEVHLIYTGGTVNMSVSCPFTRNSPHAIYQYDKDGNKALVTQVSQEELKVTELLKLINTAEDLKTNSEALEKVVRARTMGTSGDAALRDSILEMQQRVAAADGQASNAASKLVGMCEGALRNAFDLKSVEAATEKFQSSFQSTQTAAPTTQTAAPTTQTAAPTTQTAAPTTQTAAPTTQTAAPTTQTAAPAPTTTPKQTISERMFNNAEAVFKVPITTDDTKHIENAWSELNSAEKLVHISALAKVPEINVKGRIYGSSSYELSAKSHLFPATGSHLLQSLVLLRDTKWASKAVTSNLKDVVREPIRYKELLQHVWPEWNEMLFRHFLKHSLPNTLTLQQLLCLVAGDTPYSKYKELLQSNIVRSNHSLSSQLQLMERLDNDNVTLADFKQLDKDLVDLLFPVKSNGIFETKANLKQWKDQVEQAKARLYKYKIVPSTQAIKDPFKWSAITAEQLYGTTLPTYFAVLDNDPWFDETETLLLNRQRINWSDDLTFTKLQSIASKLSAETIGPNTPFRQSAKFLDTYPSARLTHGTLLTIINTAQLVLTYFDHLSEAQQAMVLRLKDEKCTTNEVQSSIRTLTNDGAVSVYGLIAHNKLVASNSLFKFIRYGLTVQGFEHFPSICNNDPELCLVARLEVPTAVKALRGLEAAKRLT